MTIKLTPRKQLFVDTASEMFGNGAILTKKQFERWELTEKKKSLETKMLTKKMIHKMKEK